MREQADTSDKSTEGGHRRGATRAASQFTRLIWACKRKNLSEIKRIIQEAPELINKSDEYHRNLLHYAAILMSRSSDSTQGIYGEGNDSCEEEEDGEIHPNGRSIIRQESSALSDVEVDANEQKFLANCLDCFQYLSKLCEKKLWRQVDLDGLSLLHLAVISCNVPLVRLVVFEHEYSIKYPLVNVLDRERHSPLHWAIITNNLSCVQMLIEHSGVDLAHQPDLNGATPLHYATQTSDYPKYRRQLRLMLQTSDGPTTNPTSVHNKSQSRAHSYEDKSRPSIATMQPVASGTCGGGGGGKPPIATQSSSSIRCRFGDQTDSASSCPMESKNLQILDYLLHLEGIRIECLDNDRRTPLLWAASSGNRGALRLLVENGANAWSQDANKLGALHCTASHGFPDCLEYLLDLIGSERQPNRLLVDQADNLNCTPLFYAVLSGNPDCVEVLLDRGAQPNWQDVKGRTVAHFGALKGRLNLLKLLELRGANLWLANKSGDLPLHYAIKSGRQQVVAWLLAKSPYERAVNAINNSGRAPIHLAIMKNNVSMADYLIGQGANLNQLVKIRGITDTCETANSGQANVALVNQSTVHRSQKGVSYRYETALDMAKRLDHSACKQLLLDHSAQSAVQVLEARVAETCAPKTGGSSSLFDLQAAEMASPIGFETGSSSAEPQSELHQQQPHDDMASSITSAQASGMPKAPRPLERQIQQCDSTGSSALSHCSLTSTKCGPTSKEPMRTSPTRHRTVPRPTTARAAGEERHMGHSHRSRPFKGGISYNNEHINASIKCKLYGKSKPMDGETKTQSLEDNGLPRMGHQESRSFPPLASQGSSGAQRQPWNRHQARSNHVQPALGGNHSVSFDRQQPIGQEIITNVNVYTSPCACCFAGTDCVHRGTRDDLRAHQPIYQNGDPGCSAPDGSTTSSDTESTVGTNELETSNQHLIGSVHAHYGDSSRHDGNRTRLPKLSCTELPNGHQRPNNPAGRQHLPPNQGYDQQLPVILSAEEDLRSTSGETEDVNKKQYQGRRTDRKATVRSPAEEEPRFDLIRRPHNNLNRHRLGDTYRERAISPVGEYIHGSSDVSLASRIAAKRMEHQEEPEEEKEALPLLKQQPINPDGSQIRARVDSCRTDSGLASSHFGDYGACSSSSEFQETLHGRRTKSFSINGSAPGGQRVSVADGLIGCHSPTGQRSTKLSDAYETMPGRYVPQDDSQLESRMHNLKRQRFNELDQLQSNALNIKSRLGGRGNVDNGELAAQIERSIRKYRRESMLFEELQNLKRSQIRSGKANETLLVKRLVDRFRLDPVHNLVVGFEYFHGPYTYKAYEWYLYDQLRKLSISNNAKVSALQLSALETINSVESAHDDYKMDSSKENIHPPQCNLADKNAIKERDYLEEDLRAEMELHRVVNQESVNPNSSFVNNQLDDNIVMNNIVTTGELGVNVIDSAIVTKIEVGDTMFSAGGQGINQLKLIGIEADGLATNILQDVIIDSAALDGSDQTINGKDTGHNDSAPTSEIEEGMKKTPYGRRRMSIINIGDKLETIYHDVGIEIERVEDKEEEDDEPRVVNIILEKSTELDAIPAVLDGCQLDRVNGSPDDTLVRDNHEQDACEKIHACDEEPQIMADVGMVEEHQDASEETMDDINLAPTDDTMHQAQTGSQYPMELTKLSNPIGIKRRDSSPPLLPINPDREHLRHLRRSESIGFGSSRVVGDVDGAEIRVKKVFNGHDLDEMHKRVRRGAGPMGAKSRQAAGALSQQTGATFRRRLERSKHPKSRLIIQVSLEEIRRRWRPIKRRERRRKELISGLEGGPNGGVQVSASRSGLDQTKSQPNLALAQELGEGSIRVAALSGKGDASKHEYSKPKGSDNDVGDELFKPTTFTLIYEINKRSKRANDTSGSQLRVLDDGGHNGGDQITRRPNSHINGGLAGQRAWCRAKMVRIVDVRQLRRTLSLPDMLIYSNDLLKRFNILKL